MSDLIEKRFDGDGTMNPASALFGAIQGAQLHGFYNLSEGANGNTYCRFCQCFHPEGQHITPSVI